MINTSCISQKRFYDTEQLALDALIQYHIRNAFEKNQGPKNIYQCDNCGGWHFTSKGNYHTYLTDAEGKEYIKKERKAFYWEKKLR